MNIKKFTLYSLIYCTLLTVAIFKILHLWSDDDFPMAVAMEVGGFAFMVSFFCIYFYYLDQGEYGDFSLITYFIPLVAGLLAMVAYVIPAALFMCYLGDDSTSLVAWVLNVSPFIVTVPVAYWGMKLFNVKIRFPTLPRMHYC